MRSSAGNNGCAAERNPKRLGDSSESKETRRLTTIPSRIDLHCHTTVSDGGLTPSELVTRAARLGIRVLGITDHDTTEGIPQALAEAQKWGITVVPGVEISTLSGEEEIHLLGYFVDPEHAELQALLACTQQARWERAQHMLDRLATLGLPIEWERVLEISGRSRSIGRPHVAATLLEAGHVSSYDEAFTRWIGRNCPAYVERYKLTPEEAIGLVRSSGGLPVLAHPYIYSRYGERKIGLDLDYWLPRLRAAGLEGLETYYPNYPRSISRQLLARAIEHELVITGGSDFHGGMLGNGMGSVAVPPAAWEGLERRWRLIHTRLKSTSQSEARSLREIVSDGQAYDSKPKN